jgi:hypothetical protein
MRIRFELALPVLLCTAGVLTGQGTENDVEVIERVALSAALTRHAGVQYATQRIAIDPAVVEAGAAPATGEVRLRDQARHRILLRGVNGTSLSPDAAVQCRDGKCRLVGADILVSLSEPEIDGGQAKVTVTTVIRVARRRGLQYVTVNVLLDRQGATWKVRGFEELGIS